MEITVAVDRDIGSQIKDDGIGIRDGPEFSGQGGLGLHNTMLALLGGTMTWKPLAPTGTCVEISLPQQRIDLQ